MVAFLKVVNTESCNTFRRPPSAVKSGLVCQVMCDVIFNNANVVTMDPSIPSAGLVAVKGDRIAAVACNEALADLQTKGSIIIDCCGRTMLPGFIDAHCHISAYAESLVTLNLSPREGVRSIPDIENRIYLYCGRNPPGSWIRGKGYNEFYLEEKRHPNRKYHHSS